MRAPLLILSSIVWCCADHARSDNFEDHVSTESGLVSDRWVRRSVAASGRVVVALRLEAKARVRAEWSDRYGYSSTARRPDCVLDLTVTDSQRRTLAGPVHNSQYNDNGLLPDGVDFITPADGRVWLEFTEVSGASGAFEFRVLSAQQADGQPSGLAVYRAGASNDWVAVPKGGFLLAGGGPDVDTATQTFVEAGDRGDVVILRMDDTGGAYAPYFVTAGAHSATELVFDAPNGNDSIAGSRLAEVRALANDAWVVSTIEKAEMVFLAGGNQTKYVDAFSSTALSAAIERLVARRGVLGGTSAGMHAIAGWGHTPRGNGNSVTSAQALNDPFISVNEVAGTASLDFAPGPFQFSAWADFIFDTHWSQRDRRGRSVTFLARMAVAGNGANRLIASDEGVAVFVTADQTARVFGPSARGASFMRSLGTPEVCVDNRQLQWASGVTEVRVSAHPRGETSFDVRSWQSADGRTAVVGVRDGALVKSR